MLIIATKNDVLVYKGRNIYRRAARADSSQ